LRDLEADAPELAVLAEGFADLRRKLPPELFETGGAEDAEALDPTAPEQLREVLGEVKDLLLARLLAAPEGA
jgi:hypothetical protein